MKTALITGASRGIGRAIATAFAKEGFRLVINCSSSKDALYDLRDELIRTHHTDVLADVGDISDHSYVYDLFLQTLAIFRIIPMFMIYLRAHRSVLAAWIF